MRPAALPVLLLAPAIFWFEPFGPWVWSRYPPAAATAPSWALVAGDTLRIQAYASRNLMPQVIGACAAPQRRLLHLSVTALVAGRPETSPVPLDSLWFIHGSEVVLDRSPSWDDAGGHDAIVYGDLPGYPVGDPVTVLVSLRGLSGGQRYLAARATVSAVF